MELHAIILKITKDHKMRIKKYEIHKKKMEFRKKINENHHNLNLFDKIYCCAFASKLNKKRNITKSILRISLKIRFQTPHSQIQS